MASATPAPSTPETSKTGSANQVSEFTRQIVDALEKISKVAEKGPVILLSSLGSVLIILAVVMKLEINGARISNLTAGEFVTMIVAATLLLVLASLLRMYHVRSNLD